MKTARLFLVIVLFAGFALVAIPVRAQLSAFAEITEPVLNTFPELVFYLDAFGNDGVFISGLKAEEITLLEDGIKHKPDRLTELTTPVNFILSINSSPVLGYRDAAAVSRYEKITQHLSNWADSLAENNRDQFAITWNGGTIASELTRGDWRVKLAEFDIHPRESTGGLDSLGYALDQAEKTPSIPGLKRSILLISGRLNADEQALIGEFINRAVESETRIYVIITDAQDYKDLPSVTSLEELALRTGGRSFLFSGSEQLPLLEQWFATLRKVYEVTYTSQIRESGDHNLSAQIDHAGLTLSSNLTSFELDLLPPNIALLSPPIEIVRDDPERRFNLENYQPVEVSLQILVEFPDKRERRIVLSELIVDGQVVAVNLTEPFERLTWDLSDTIASADHLVAVRVEDAFGFSVIRTAIPIMVTVVPPPGGVFAIFITEPLASGAAVAAILLVILLIFISRRGKIRESAAQIQTVEPVVLERTSPEIKQESSPAQDSDWLEPVTAGLKNFTGWLLPLDEDDKLINAPRIRLRPVPFQVGSDPSNNLILADRSIAKFHAVINREIDGTFIVVDLKTLTGTWIDHESVHGKGKALKNANLLHFGRMGYLYEEERGENESA